MKKEALKKFGKRPFKFQQAIAAGMTKYELYKLVKAGAIEKINRGIYQISEQEEQIDENQFKVATLRCGKLSAICLVSALAHYQLTDQIPRSIWILVPAPKRVQDKSLRLVRSRNPVWDVGIVRTRDYNITSIERTLIDCLIFKRLVGLQTAISALREALKQRKVKLGDLFDIAKKMGVLNQVRSYLEAFSA